MVILPQSIIGGRGRTGKAKSYRIVISYRIVVSTYDLGDGAEMRGGLMHGVKRWGGDSANRGFPWLHLAMVSQPPIV